MTEQLAQRSLLNAKQKCDINQLFKSKMKLINDASVTNASLALNASSSNSSSQSSLLNQQIVIKTPLGSAYSSFFFVEFLFLFAKNSTNKTNGASADEAPSAHDACNTNETHSNAANLTNCSPTSIKEVLYFLIFIFFVEIDRSNNNQRSSITGHGQLERSGE